MSKELDNIINVIDLLEKIKALLTGMVSHSMLITESVKELVGDAKSVNQNMREAALGLKALVAEAMKADLEFECAILDKKADAVQAANDAMPVIVPWAEKVQNAQQYKEERENS